MRTILLLCVMFLVSGCVSNPLAPVPPDLPDGCAPPVSAEDVHVQEELPTYDRSVEVVVRSGLTDEGIWNATVVAQWNSTTIDQDPREAAVTTPIHYIAVATGLDGTASFTVPSDTYVLISAVAPGHAQEWTPLFEPGQVPETVNVTLFADRATVSVSGLFAGPAASAADDLSTRWQAQDLLASLGDDGLEHLRRAAWVEGRLSWNLTGQDVALMRIGIGPSPSELNHSVGPLPSGTGPSAERYEYIWSGSEVFYWSGLWIGPYAEAGWVAPDGIEWHLDARLEVGLHDVYARDCHLFKSAAKEQQFPGDGVELTASGAGVQAPVFAGSLVLAAAAAFAVGFLVARRK